MLNSGLDAYLQKLLHSKRIPHVLLFAGSAHSSAEASAFQFARQIVGQNSNEPHPDLYHFSPEGKLGLHTIETMRYFSSEVYLSPYQASYKVFLILEAERMAATSANALLKTFEEPLSTSLIFLVSHFPEKLLATVRSRCQVLYFPGVTQTTLKSHPLLINILIALPTSSYPELLAQVAALADAIEKEAAVIPLEEQELSALQKQAREKEEEGKYALTILRATESLWEQLLGWFRDMHLLHLNGNSHYLFHPTQELVLRDLVETGRLPSLDQLQKIVAQTRLTLERSTPLKNALESLFLAIKKLC